MNHVNNESSVKGELDPSIEALRRKGVHLWIENGVLRYRAPKGVITADDIAALHRLDNSQLSALTTHRERSSPQPSLATGMRPRLAPLSFNQLAHWQLREASDHRPIRQVAFVTRINGPLQVTAMKEAVAVVRDRHEALRTHIVNVNGEIMQEATEHTKDTLQIVEMSNVPAYERASEIRAQIASAIVDVSNYFVDPLSIVVLLKLEEAESVLILAMDHIVSDGVSRSILEDEIFSAYEQLVSGRQVSLPVVRMQYADYAIWQRTMLAEYIKTQGAAGSAWCRTRFPADASARGGEGWGQVSFTINGQVRSALEEWARRKGTTLVMTVLTAYVALVIRWCQVFDTLVHVTFNGRTSRLIENTIGYIAYPLYLHVATDERVTFIELLGIITAEYCRACERPNFYHAYTLNPRPEFTRNTCFNWVPKRGSPTRADLPTGSESTRRSHVAHEDLLLEHLNVDVEPGVGFQDTGREISGAVVFPRAQFSAHSMARFSRALGLFLDGIVTSPSVCIREMQMM